MADITQHNYTGKYSGLLNNFWVTLTIAGICLVGYEIEVQIPRRRGKDGTFQRIHVRLYRASRRAWARWQRRKRKSEGGHERPSQEVLVRDKGGFGESGDEAREKLGSREQWEFAYIHRPKAWRLNPAPPLPRWPLAWIWSSLKVKEQDMPETCGLDLTLHMRFLRGAFFYTLLQACVVLPILMPLHIFYSSDEISPTSMTRASVSSLVDSSGKRWLWVHAVLIWWVTITWTMTVLWIGWGALAYRRREIRRLAARLEAAREEKRQLTGGEDGLAHTAEGWIDGEESEGIKKFRTLMVTNVPPDMRDERILRDYFDHYIHLHRVRLGHTNAKKAAPAAPDAPADPIIRRIALSPRRLLRRPAASKVDSAVLPTPSRDSIDTKLPANGDERAQIGEDDFESEVDDVILVRKLGSVASLRARRLDVLRQLEVAHVKLAQRVLNAVRKHKAKYPEVAKSRAMVHPTHDVAQGIDGLNAARDERIPEEISKKDRLDRLVQALGAFVGDEPEQLGRGQDTVWDVLHCLPRELLDPYQSLTHLTSIFRKQNAPLIDYLTTKLSYLTLRLDEARAKPLSSYSASSTAFVTFKDARTARLALKILDSHPKRSLACHTVPAPDWTELLWPRLAKSVYRSEFVRGWVVYIGVWAFTLVWIFPVSILCALSSLTKIAELISPLETFINNHPDTANAITSLVPVLLVAGLTIAICPILLVIANKAETITTRLGIHNSVLERFWKFLMVNGVVFFAIGQSAIQAYLNAFQNSNFDPLPTVATAFPTAAPYFASYVLLQTAIQPFFELFRLGLPAIVYVFGTRVSVIPRQRDSRTEHPTFSHFSQVPQQLLTVAIMHLFMLLNPLVIPFCLVFYGSCYVVWKKQFTYVYGRLYENNGRRTSVRVLRYSLDALALAQFVLFAFFILNKAQGHAIATGILCFLTLVEKIVITRALKRRFDNLDIQEADLLCPPAASDQGDPSPPDQERLEDWTDVKDPPAVGQSPTSNSSAASWREKITSTVHRWAYAANRKTMPTSYRKPTPLEQALFSALDTKITFEGEHQAAEKITSFVNSPGGDELRHGPDRPIMHDMAAKLVTPHHALRPWEDIPPYQRMRGYDDQPDYTDDYDDFLWLPRDPLSTLDLDDTVEMRLSLTTSAGGSGRIGNWPPALDDDHDTTIVEGETCPDVFSQDLDRYISPDARSDHPLIDTPFSRDIGSEVEYPLGTTGVIRRGTRKVGQGLSSMFKRPRRDTGRTASSDSAISLRTFSITSSPSIRVTSSSRISTDAGLPHHENSTIDRPSIMLVNSQPGPSRLDTPTLPLTGNSFVKAGPVSSTNAVDSSPFLSPTRMSTSQQIAPRQDPEDTEELNIASPPRPSRLTFLGRSPSGRRPSRAKSNPKLGESSSQPSNSSVVSPARCKSARLGRDRSSSIWSNRQIHERWLQEVMDEENLARQDAEREELEEEAKDFEELEKEEKRRRGSSSAHSTESVRTGSRQGGGPMRSGSFLGAARSLSVRVGSDSRSGDLAERGEAVEESSVQTIR